MGMGHKTMKRAQSRGEEIANSISHGIGLLASVVGVPFLLFRAFGAGQVGFFVGASIFCLSMVLLYLASTLYHALPRGRTKRLFKTLEHSAIFILIAGTYSPFSLGALLGPWGWTLLGVIWSLAVTGVVLKARRKMNHPIVSTGLYLLMGWLIVVAAAPLSEAISPAGLRWLVAGGLAYSLGVIFFALDSRLRYGHFVWHLFVMAGTLCHYFAIYWHAV